MTSVKYIGTFTDHSGYGAANRMFITALWTAGVNVTTELVVQVPERTSFGVTEAICRGLLNRDINHKINIIHLTPDCYPRYINPKNYNIGHLFWESDKFPREWMENINKMDEIWTASDKWISLFKKAGVRVPIHAFPQPIDITVGDQNISAFKTQYQKDFTFYSIFQWIERKNPRGLLRAYWKAFEGRDDVTLLLKTYRVTYSEEEYKLLTMQIDEWKKEMGGIVLPKIFLVKKLLTDNEIYKLHMLGDCFINPSSAEGWNRPMQEAMLLHKPVISCDNGGITDYMKDDMYYKVNSHQISAIQQNFIPWYTADMHWWELEEDSLISRMKEVFDQRNFEDKIKKSHEFIVNETSFQKVGQKIKERLEQIERIL